MAISMAGVYVQPKTINNLKVSNGTNTYPVEELNDYTLDADGYYFTIGTNLKLDVGNLTFTADNCQTQTYDCYTDTAHTIVMEPATGYKKLYAWKKSETEIYYTDTLDIKASSTTTGNDGNGTTLYDANGNAVNFVTGYQTDSELPCLDIGKIG